MDKIIIYQVLPRLFGNRTKKLVQNGSLKQNGCGKFNDFTPETLGEIKKLGVSHIWFTGVIEHATQTDYSEFGIEKDHSAVVKGKAGSPYAIKDYYDADPDLAENVKDRMKEFHNLITNTHKAGLKAIIDFVPNHVARQYKSDAKPKKVKDLGEDDNKDMAFCKDNNFYYIPNQSFVGQFNLSDENGILYSEYPAKVTGNDCFRNDPSAFDWFETVKLNYGINYADFHKKEFSPVPNTWNKMLEILLFWAKKKVDGFRCDMAEMVPVEFWGWAIPQVKAKHPDIIFIAETYDRNKYATYLNDGQFDYLYDKVGLYDTLRGIVAGFQPASNITGSWKCIDGLQNRMLNFLENHDEQRIASDFFAGNAVKALPAMLISATMSNGPVLIYFGQEFGEKGMDCEGFSGADGRTSIFDYWAVSSVQNWINDGKFDGKKLKKEQKDIYNFYSKLLNICAKSEAIANGAFFDLMYVNYENDSFNTEKQYCFARKSEKELLIIVANFADTPHKLKINLPQHAFELLGISEKEYYYEELLTGSKGKANLSSNVPFSVSVKKYNGGIYKFKL